MSLIVRMRRQKAIYWAQTSARDKYGKMSFSAPVEIDCRWDDVKGTYVDHNGERRASLSTVYVDRDIQVGDRLQLGSIESDTPEDPLQSDLTYEVKQFSKIPNLHNTEYLRIASMQWQTLTKS